MSGNLYAQGDGYELHLGDCIEVMRGLPAESVDAIVTSPPYAEQRKSTYGGIPEGEYPEWSVAWMREAKRLLKPDGSVIINVSPHIRNGQISDYVLRTRLALREDGWAELMELIWHKTDPIPTGRPDRPRRSWEPLLWYGKHGRAYGDPKAAGHETTRGTMKYLGSRKGGDMNHHGHGYAVGRNDVKIARVTDVFSSATNNENHNHPAPYPVALAEWCGKLICPTGGVILDPFSGSASTGVAALKNGWHYVGIDAVPEYLDMSKRRLDATSASLDETILNARDAVA